MNDVLALCYKVLALYAAPVDFLLHLPYGSGNLVVGLQLMIKIALGGWVLARTGRSPLWILLLLVPYADVIGLWVFAYAVWPAEALVRRATAESEELPPPDGNDLRDGASRPSVVSV